MAQGKGRQPRAEISRDKEVQLDIKKLYGLNQTSNAVQQVSSSLAGSANQSPNQPQSQFLKTIGDTMVGPIAFFPNAITIASDAIDIGKDTEKYTSYIIITAQSGTADNLATITGAAFSGQMLWVQPISTHTITIKDGTGNIRTNTGADFVLGPSDTIAFIFDPTVGSGQWSLVSASTAAVSGANQSLSNLTDPTSVNQNLIPQVNIDLGTTADPFQETYTNEVIFPDDIGGFTGGSPREIRALADGLGFNLDNVNDLYRFYVTGEDIGSISRVGSSQGDLVIFQVTPSKIGFLDSSSDPSAVPGRFSRNGVDMKVYSGGAIRNFSDIGAGGGADVNLNNLAAGAVAVNTDLDPNGIGTEDMGNTTNYWADWFGERLIFPANVALAHSFFGIGREDFGGATAALTINVPTNTDFRIMEEGDNADPLMLIDSSAGIVSFDGGIGGLQISPDALTTTWNISVVAGTNAQYGATNGHEFLQKVQFGDTASTSIIVQPDGDMDFNANQIVDIANITMAQDGDIDAVRNMQAVEYRNRDNPTNSKIAMDSARISYHDPLQHRFLVGGFAKVEISSGEIFSFINLRINGSIKLTDTTESFIDFEDIVVPAVPAPNSLRLFADSSESPEQIKVIKDTGEVVSLEGGGISASDSPIFWTGIHSFSNTVSFTQNVNLGVNTGDLIAILGLLTTDLIPLTGKDLGSPSSPFAKLYLLQRLKIPVGNNLFD